MPANSSKNDKNISSHLIKIIFCGFISSLIYFGLIAVFAAAALKSDFSTSSYMVAGLIIGAITGFSGGFIISKVLKEKGALYGAVCGCVQALISTIILFMINGGTAGKGMLILSAIIIVFSVAGGISGVNLKIKKKY